MKLRSRFDAWLARVVPILPGEYSALDNLGGLTSGLPWFAQCTGERHHGVVPSVVHGPFATEDAAAHAHHWHTDCTVKTFQKEES